MATNDEIILTQLLEERRAERAPSMSESDYFELFSAEQTLKDFDLSYEDIQAGIVGAGGDGGIDSIYVFANGELLYEDTDITKIKGSVSISIHISQAKRSTGYSESALEKLRTSVSELFDLSKPLAGLAPVYNEQLLSIVSKFREAHQHFASRLPKLSFHFRYATLGNEVHPNTERLVPDLEKTVQTLFSSASYRFDFMGARELLELARKEPTTSYTLALAENPTSVEKGSFICLVSLPSYFDFISDDDRFRRELFDANVRDYQGDVEINRAIRDTLDSPKDEDFWWLNNGVTIIAADSQHSGKSLAIRDPQIVNGLQTSQEIYNAFTAQDLSLDKRNILVRVIEPKTEESYQRIVRATNSQTSIPPASLRATDPIHRNIEDYLKSHKYYYERRKNFYKNQGRPKDAIVSIPYLSQAIMSVVLGRPNDARGRPSTLIKKDEDYGRVFDPKLPIEVYAVCVSLVKRVELCLKKGGSASTETNNLRFHVAYLASRLRVGVQSPSAAKLKSLKVDALDDAFVESCIQTVKSIYNKLGGNDQVAKGRKFLEEVSSEIAKATSAKLQKINATQKAFPSKAQPHK